ncbi:MAG: cell wall hydrolase [Candidimonas sp.]
MTIMELFIAASLSFAPTDTSCMALAIYHESRGEGIEGMKAVAWTVKNRHKSDLFPNNICDVVFEQNKNGCQFSWVCDENPLIPYDEDAWIKAKAIAKKVIKESNKNDPTGGALFFHNINDKPYWAKDDRFIETTIIKNHQFYAIMVDNENHLYR